MYTPEIIDTVESFSAYTKLSKTLVYQYTRGAGFPKIQACKNGKILIDRAAALDWLRTSLPHVETKRYPLPAPTKARQRI